MLISEEEASTRLSSVDNLINRLELRKIHNGGRPKGRNNDSHEDRLAIATHSIIHGPSETAREFDTTPSRASLLSNGIITHGIGADSKLAPAVRDKKQLIHEKALDIIMASLDSIGQNLDGVKKPADLASIASDMAKIAERTGGRLKEEESNKPQVQVVIYAPRIRSAGEYEEVEI